MKREEIIDKMSSFDIREAEVKGVGKVHFRPLSIAAAMRVHKALIDNDRLAMAREAVFDALLDEDGKPVFSDQASKDEFDRMPAPILAELSNLIQQASELEIEEAEGK